MWSHAASERVIIIQTPVRVNVGANHVNLARRKSVHKSDIQKRLHEATFKPDSPLRFHYDENEKLIVLFSSPPTVTSAVWVPNFSCHASSVYVPSGKSAMVNFPSSPVIA